MEPGSRPVPRSRRVHGRQPQERAGRAAAARPPGLRHASRHRQAALQAGRNRPLPVADARPLHVLAAATRPALAVLSIARPGDAMVSARRRATADCIGGLKPVIGPDGKPLRGIGVGEYDDPPPTPGRRVQARTRRSETRDTRSEVLLDTRQVPRQPLRAGRLREEAGVRRQELRPGRHRAGSHRSFAHRRRADEGRAGATSSPPSTARHRSTTEKDVQASRSSPTRPAGRRRRFSTCGSSCPPTCSPAGPKGKPLRRRPGGATFRTAATRRPIVRPIPLVDEELQRRVLPRGRRPDRRRAEPRLLQVRTPNGKPADLKGDDHRRHEHRLPKSRR